MLSGSYPQIRLFTPVSPPELRVRTQLQDYIFVARGSQRKSYLADAARGTRILCAERSAVNLGGHTLNLPVVDSQALRGHVEAPVHSVDQYLPAVERLLVPDTVNILLSHNTNTFDRAAELGIDLSLSGHTHGGQLALELPHTCLAPVRLITPYIHGWSQNHDAHLYVNRCIGTLTFPMRRGARPEITVFESVRTV